MIISRIVPLTRLALQGPLHKKFISTSAKRMGGAPWTYREFTPASKGYELWAEIAGGIFWWWVVWHLLTDYPHLVGEKSWIYPQTWTDAELGIPPDDADDPE